MTNKQKDADQLQKAAEEMLDAEAERAVALKAKQDRALQILQLDLSKPINERGQNQSPEPSEIPEYIQDIMEIVGVSYEDALDLAHPPK